MVSFPNEYIFSDYSVFTMDMAFICEVDNLLKIIPADDVSEVDFLFPKEIRLQDFLSDSMRNIVTYFISKYL